jgi:hypothetical protein
MTVVTGPVADAPPAVRPWVLTAVAALAAAGVLHLAAAADHVGGPDLVVAFFLAVAVAQLGTAVWLTVGARAAGGPRPLVLAGVAAGTAGLLVLYLLSRTTTLLDGLTAAPVSPGSPVQAGHGGHAATSADGGSALAALTELLGPATVVVQTVLLLALVALLPERLRRVTVNGLTILGALAWASWLAGILS